MPLRALMNAQVTHAQITGTAKNPGTPDAAHAISERSTTVAATPRRERKYAIAAPITPPPQITTCAARALVHREKLAA